MNRQSFKIDNYMRKKIMIIETFKHARNRSRSETVKMLASVSILSLRQPTEIPRFNFATKSAISYCTPGRFAHIFSRR